MDGREKCKRRGTCRADDLLVVPTVRLSSGLRFALPGLRWAMIECVRSAKIRSKFGTRRHTPPATGLNGPCGPCRRLQLWGRTRGCSCPLASRTPLIPTPIGGSLSELQTLDLLLLRSSLAHPFRSSSTRLRTREVIHPISCQVLAVLSKPALGSLYRSKLCKFMH